MFQTVIESKVSNELSLFHDVILTSSLLWKTYKCDKRTKKILIQWRRENWSLRFEWERRVVHDAFELLAMSFNHMQNIYESTKLTRLKTRVESTKLTRLKTRVENTKLTRFESTIARNKTSRDARFVWANFDESTIQTVFQIYAKSAFDSVLAQLILLLISLLIFLQGVWPIVSKYSL